MAAILSKNRSKSLNNAQGSRYKNLNYADQQNEIQAAKDVLKTPKRIRFRESNEVIDIRDSSIDTLSMSLPKRSKLA